MPVPRSVRAARSARGAQSWLVTQDGEVDLLLGAELHHLSGRRVGSEVVDMPVRVAQRHRRHRGRERMVVTGNRCDRDDAPPPPSGVGYEVAEDALDDRRARCSAEIGSSPRCQASPMRWSDGTTDALQQDDDLGAFGDELAGDAPRPWLVAADERVVDPLLLRFEATHAGRTSRPRGAQLGLHRGEVAGLRRSGHARATRVVGRCAPIGRRSGSARRARRPLLAARADRRRSLPSRRR